MSVKSWTWLNAVLSAGDTYVWEPLMRRFPVLQRLDGANWKSWFGHSLVTLVGAYLLALLPWVPVHVGAWVMVWYYLIRETSARMALGWSYKRLDGAMDVLCPVLVAVVLTWVYYGR